VILEKIGLKEAEIILAVTDSDEVSLVVCLVADILSPSIKKLARLKNTDYDGYHDNFRKVTPCIDTIINPEIELVKTIDQLMNVPGAIEVDNFADGQVKFVGIILNKTARVAGAHLSELSARIGKPFPLIAAIVRGEELIIPSGDDRLLAGDEVYFISEEDKVFGYPCGV
jgi:trk system potassium uptake protein TrkA